MTDYDFFINNLVALYKKYGHCFIVIKNESVIGVYNNFDDALTDTLKTENPGTFLIQECVEDPKELVLTFQGNVAFSL